MKTVFREGRSGAVVVALLTVGCSLSTHRTRSNAPTPEEIASIAVREFAGSGGFVLGRERRTLPRLDFVILSSGQGTSAGALVMLHGARGIPRVGRYPVIPIRRTAADSSAFEALFASRQGTRVENFAAQSGEIDIRESSARRVTGTFRIIVRPYCRAVGTRIDDSCSPLRITSGAPPVIVRGSFVASAIATPGRRAR